MVNKHKDSIKKNKYNTSGGQYAHTNSPRRSIVEQDSQLSAPHFTHLALRSPYSQRHILMRGCSRRKCFVYSIVYKHCQMSILGRRPVFERGGLISMEFRPKFTQKSSFRNVLPWIFRSPRPPEILKVLTPSKSSGLWVLMEMVPPCFWSAPSPTSMRGSNASWFSSCRYSSGRFSVMLNESDAGSGTGSGTGVGITLTSSSYKNTTNYS